MKIALKSSIAMVAILSLFACGGDASKKAPAVKKEVTKVEEVKEKKIVEITLAAQGEDMTAISFEPKSLSIPAGSRVKLTFENKSQAAGMYHNFVLVKLGTGQEVATAGIQAGEANSFVPSSDNVIVNTEVVEMGGSTVLEFDAPAKGSYHYICTYPGHTNMIGRLNVE